MGMENGNLCVPMLRIVLVLSQTKKIGKDLSAGIADPLAHRGILEQELKGQSDAVELG